MSRLSLVLPAAAMLLAGAMTATTAEAAPAAGIPEALKAAASQESAVARASWWDRYRWYRHGDRDRGHHRWGRWRDHDNDRGHHRWGRWRDRYDG